MSKYFIRYPDSEEAKGPYNVEQLQSLSEAKKVKPDTLYYDEDKEVWVAVNSNEDLNESLFVTKKRNNSNFLIKLPCSILKTPSMITEIPKERKSS